MSYSCEVYQVTCSVHGRIGGDFDYLFKAEDRVKEHFSEQKQPVECRCYITLAQLLLPY